MVRLRRNSAPSAIVAARVRNGIRLSNGSVFDNGHQNSSSSRRGAKNCIGRPLKRKLVTKSKFERHLENMVSQDPKLNGKLIPTVALENSTDKPNGLLQRKSQKSTESPSPRANRGSTDRTLRTRNPPEPGPGSSPREKPKLYKNCKVELVRVKTRKSLSCLNMLAPVFADCKLNGASAPRVVLKRLDLDQLLRNGIGPVKLHQNVRKRDIPPKHDLKTRMKRIRASRNHGATKQSSANQRRRRTRGQRFEPVPCHEKKWWNSFPLRQVAVRLTKLPL